MDMLSNVMWLHPKISEIQRFCVQSLPLHGLQIILPKVRSREIFPVSVLLNCRMDMSSPRADRAHRFFQEHPSGSSSS